MFNQARENSGLMVLRGVNATGFDDMPRFYEQTRRGLSLFSGSYGQPRKLVP